MFLWFTGRIMSLTKQVSVLVLICLGEIPFNFIGMTIQNFKGEFQLDKGLMKHFLKVTPETVGV